MQSPPLSILESGFYNKGCEDYNFDYDAHHQSYRARSRAGTNASRTTTADLKQNYFDSPQSLPLSSPSLTSQSASSVASSISYLSPLPSSYLPTPIPRTFSPFPGLSPEILGGEWNEQDSVVVGEPAHARKSSNASLASVSAAAMSSAALGITSAFPMGDKANFWPGMMPGPNDNSNTFLGHDLAMAGAAGQGSDFAAGGSRSLTSSPRQGMTAEQREIKRQMDQARRDSKTATRYRRSGSSPYLSSAEATPGLTMPVYTTSMAPISLLAEPATSIPQPGYMSTSYSQPLEPNSSGLPTPSMYSTAVPQHHQPPPMQSAYNVPVEFPSAFQQHAPSYGRARPASISGGSDPNLLYPIPPVLTPNPHHHQHQHPHQNQHQHQQAVEAAGHVRVLQSRPKPQCWEHGCNGRQFSTFSNLLRHQREKSGQASKATCPNCGAEFTRTTARNGHLLQGKCKRRGTGASGDEGGMPLTRTPSTSSLADGRDRSPMPDM